MPTTKQSTRRRIRLPGKDYVLNLPRKTSEHPHGYLSATQIDSFLRCPESYRREYVLGESALGGAALLEGHLHHRVLETSNRSATNGNGRLTSGEASQLFEDLLDGKDWTDRYTATGSEISEMMERAPTFQKIFHRDYAVPRPIGVEHRFEIEIAGVTVVGYIDMVEEARAWDYKFVGRMPSQYKYWAQRAIYAQALGQDFGMESPLITILPFVKTQKPYCKPLESHHNLKKQRKWLEFQISTIAETISNGVFVPVSPDITWKCSSNFCAFYKSCFARHN